MGKHSNRRKSNRIQRTATSVTTKGMTVSRQAGITMEQAALAAALMMALTVNDLNAAMTLSNEIESTGVSIFDFEINIAATGANNQLRLLEMAWLHDHEQVILWITQKALDDGLWQKTRFLMMLPTLMEQYSEDSPTSRLAVKAVRLMANRVTKQVITELRSDGIVNFDGVERFWDHVPPKTQAIFQDCFASHLSQLEKADLVAATVAPVMSANGTRSTSNRL